MRASFGKIPITPKNLDHGVQMAGFYRKHMAYDKLDDIYARAALFENITLNNVRSYFLLISVDLFEMHYVLGNYIKDKIKQQVEFSLGHGQILICATHTHHGPDITGQYLYPGGIGSTLRGIMFGHNRHDRYIVWIARQIVKLVQQLKETLVPSKMSWAKAPITENVWINRRHPSDRTPQELGIIAVRRTDSDQLYGLIVNYGLHPTTMSFMNDKISADYPGVLADWIEHHTSPAVNVVFFTGAAGDINAITTCGTDFKAMEHEDVPLFNNDPKGTNHYMQLGTYEHTLHIGEYLAQESMKVAQAIPISSFYDKLQINAYLKIIWMSMDDNQHEKRIGILNLRNWFTNKITIFLKKWFLAPIILTSAKNPNFPPKIGTMSGFLTLRQALKP